jgi:hypothetical protein
LKLDLIRQRLETMQGELSREYYETQAGIRAESRLAVILERYRDLAERTVVTVVEDRLAAAAGAPTEERRLRMLREALAVNHEDYRLRELDDRLNNLEASLTVEVEGEAIAYRDLSLRARAATERDRRRTFHRAMLAAMADQLRPLHRERILAARRTAADLGYAGYVEMVSETSGIDLPKLSECVRPILERTEEQIRSLLSGAMLRSGDLELADAESHDMLAVFRASRFDHYFAAGGEMSLASGLVERGLGLDLTASGRIRLDLEPRPLKTPRAFCATVRVPDEVYLVTKPSGGVDDYSAFFHELGHALHFAYVDGALPVEYRRLGDNSVTEGFAVLIEGILRQRAWAERHLGSDLELYLEHAALQELWFYRRYSAKLAYELELWNATEPEIDRLADRYVAHLGVCAPVPVDAERFLADLDLHFYAARYLRAWLLAAILRRKLRADFGDAWFESRRAGRLLREIWSHGQRYDADELARELGQDGLSAEPLLEEVEALTR